MVHCFFVGFLLLGLGGLLGRFGIPPGKSLLLVVVGGSYIALWRGRSFVAFVAAIVQRIQARRLRRAAVSGGGEVIPAAAGPDKDLARQIDRAEALLLRLYDRREKLEYLDGQTDAAQKKLYASRKWRALEYDIATAERRLADLESISKM